MTDSDTYQAALAYAARGWSLVALHWITAAGQCSCGTVGCKSAGKHPRDKRWQQGPATAGMPDRWGGGNPENIGIRTGTPSGFWVLDFDPDDADAAGGALFGRLHTDLGMRPHVRTGGGGYHWRFELPADGREIRNRQSAGGGAGRTHGLPRGWDVRGEGGQVVAPPSVSAKGAYVELSLESEQPWGLYVPPAWLLDMVRPAERDDPPSHTVPGAWSPLLPGPTGSGDQAGGGFAGTGFGESSHSADRIQAYCTAALIAECEEYASLTDGRRGEAAAAFGRRLVELANLARWPLDAVQDHFSRAMDAAAANGGGGGYAPHEVAGQWARAVEHVGGRAAVMPPGLDVMPGFSHAGAAVPADLRTVAGGDVQHGVNGAGAAPVTATTPVPNMPPPVDPFERIVLERLTRKLADREADRRLAGLDVSRRPTLASRVLTGDTLDSVPDPVPLVDGWLFLDSTARINGRPGQGKSFVAADLLCSVATGTPWAGLPTRQGTVLAVVAEGVSGFKLRIRAWESDRGRTVGAGLHLVPFPVQTLEDTEWTELIEYAVAVRPALITLDTQARMSVGARENDAADMGRVLAAVERLRAATGACVVLVHHATKSGDSEGGRGSNAMEGGVTSEFYVSKSGHTIAVKTTRQKDIESDAKVNFALKPVDKSAVLTTQVEIIEPIGEIWKTQAIALYEIMRTARADGETWGGIQTTAKAHPAFAGKALKFITHAWNNLLLRGLVIQRIGTQRFSVHVMETVGTAGVLTPNVGDGAAADPHGWQTYLPDLIKEDSDFTVNLGMGGRLGK